MLPAEVALLQQVVADALQAQTSAIKVAFPEPMAEVMLTDVCYVCGQPSTVSTHALTEGRIVDKEYCDPHWNAVKRGLV